ncbi:MAG: hypothetical protein SFW09_08070, partial [Hyphomicrobiaceae bacterium]|nr:hypothetical protein [Hyphomicrobiaceae bacterium]
GAGLAKVCGELAQIAGENRERLRRIAAPHYGLRAASGAVLLAGAALLAYVGTIIVKLKAENTDLFGVLQGIEASVNLLLVTGAAVFSLVTLEARWKRKQALDDLHELRSIVHVIDMHQLTKDPSTNPAVTPPTASSPPRLLKPAELVRYLDYCSEMLSLTAKVAALYAQHSTDAAVLEAVNDLERLTTNLSSKIWQKINIVQAMVAATPTTSVPATTRSAVPGVAIPVQTGAPGSGAA